MKNEILITFSVINHNHDSYLPSLFDSIMKNCNFSYEIILTQNLNKKTNLQYSKYISQLIINSEVKGFGENHNNAFIRSNGKYFVVLNPDIVFLKTELEKILNKIKNIKNKILAPQVFNQNGILQDNARIFPTFFSIISRVFQKNKLDYVIKDENITVDWAAGMFLLFPKELYKTLGGFDTSYYMYFEDVDICWRAKQKKIKVILCPQIKIIHFGQRASKKNIVHFIWHVISLITFYKKNLINFKF